MASWSAKQREPLFDQGTRMALERRGKELLGAGLVLLGLAVAMMLVSFTPDDPGFLAATDAPAQNLLGLPGAYIASALFMLCGHGAWGIVVAAMVWGLRLLLHKGEGRWMRALFLPLALVPLAAYFSSVPPAEGWAQSFGLGGHFGDMTMGALLSVMPLAPAAGLKLAAVLTAVAAGWLGAFALGVDRAEALSVLRFLRRGLGTARQVGGVAVGRGAQASARGVAAAKSRAAARRKAAPAEAGDESPLRMQALLQRLQRKPAPVEDADYDEDGDALPSELVERAPPQTVTEAPDDEHVRRSILSAVTARLGRGKPETRPEDDDDEGEVIEAEPIRPFGADTRRVVVPPAPRSGPSRQARDEAQPSLNFDGVHPGYECPPLGLLTAPGAPGREQLSAEALMENARMLEAVLDDYGVRGQITEVRPGPVVTLYELEPAPGLKASRVIGLSDDIARSMSALSARVSTVPGRSVIGIELPNLRREKVLLREILGARAFGDSSMPLPLALGKDIGGEPVVANLAKMPHLLIAGTTGSGKSVAINTMILSLLYKLRPEECRLIMIDPKMLELSVYDGIPHLLSPVVTDPKKAVVALKWVVSEMEERYRRMSKMGVRNIEGYNTRVREALDKGEMFKRTVQTGFDEDTGEPIFETEEFQPEAFPYIVVIVDEMADLMMVAGKEIEACIQRLAQMARASGIHLIMATQRPSVDVITGTIKANFPTRISFQVTSKIDSRTILGEQGAEQLLGMGDMLYMAGGSRITRVHGPFVSDEEVEEVVNHLKSFGPPCYMSGVVEGPDDEVASDIDAVLGLGGDGGDDQLYDQAVAIVAKDRKCSTSYIQRKLAIGYNKAARLVEQMEEQGVVSAANHVGKREVLIPEV